MPVCVGRWENGNAIATRRGISHSQELSKKFLLASPDVSTECLPACLPACLAPACLYSYFPFVNTLIAPTQRETQFWYGDGRTDAAHS